MSTIYQIHNVTSCQQLGVVVFGKFDGVHRGHQNLLRNSHEIAKLHALPLTVIILDIDPDKPVLTTHRTKVALIRKIIPEACIVYHDLTKDYQFYTPQQFMERVIWRYLKPKHIVVGENFHFGYEKTGNTQTLQDLSGQYHYQLHITHLKDHNVSSTLARQCISAGNMEKLAKILGRYWWIDGRVLRGVQEKNTCQSANIDIDNYIEPRRGVYIAYSKIIDSPDHTWYPAVAYFGNAPTTLNRPKNILEVHLLNQNLHLYDSTLRVLFFSFLRPDQKFINKDLLNIEIKNDILQANTQIKNLKIDWCQYE